MGYSFMDIESESGHKILSGKEIDDLGLYLSRDDKVLQFHVNWRHNEDYTKHWVYVDQRDVSDRYKPLMKVGCG